MKTGSALGTVDGFVQTGFANNIQMDPEIVILDEALQKTGSGNRPAIGPPIFFISAMRDFSMSS